MVGTQGKAVAIVRLSAAVLLILATQAPAAVAGWFPDRPIYDYNRRPNTDCTDFRDLATDHGRCGSIDGPVFNSFVNTPSYGDERSFFDARLGEQAQSKNTDPLNVPNGAEEAVLRAYVNNDANAYVGYRSIASGAKVRILLPTSAGERLRIGATISADNAVPRSVNDSADLVARHPISLSYVPGSARLLRSKNSYPLNDSIVAFGAPIGYDSMNGSLPAGFDKAAIVELRVRIFDATPTGSVPYMPITAAVVLVGLITFGRTRRRLVELGGWWSAKIRDPAVHNQVIAGLLLVALTALIGVLIKLAL